ncbi:MAG TPA: TMEM165/GDT1 family protein [Myxococcales bacterium]|nr:TMEM165/GDT1 family protein [Myxococcales bacterium]
MNFAALFTTFGLIFLAELPDKTAYTMLLLAARGRPVQVFLGSCAAFAVQGLVAVALGSLAAKLPPQAIRYLAAAMFLGFGLWLLFSPVEPDEKQAPLSKNRALAQSFVLVFLAELGDATQLGTAALVARLDNRWSVYAGSTLALWAVALLAVSIGGTVGAKLPKKALRKTAGALFCVFAVASLVIGR